MPRAIALIALVVISIAGSTPIAAGQTPAATPGAAPALAEFVREIPISPDATGAPGGVAVDASGTLYVIDSLNNQIRVFDRDGNPVTTLGQAGTGPAQFRFQGSAGFWGDLELGPDGNLYVLDTFNNRVQVLAPDGASLREWGASGSGEGQFKLPRGIAVDGMGRVYVADTRNVRVQVFAADGQFLYAWAPLAGTSPSPELGDVAVDAAGTVSVTDYDRDVVYRFDAVAAEAGNPSAPVTELGGLVTPWGAAVDAEGNLYVTEYVASRIQIFAPDGTSLGTVGSLGSKPGQFVAPIYVAIGPDGLLYVADETNHRVQIFRLLPPLGIGTATPAIA